MTIYFTFARDDDDDDDDDVVTDDDARDSDDAIASGDVDVDATRERRAAHRAPRWSRC